MKFLKKFIIGFLIMIVFLVINPLYSNKVRAATDSRNTILTLDDDSLVGYRSHMILDDDGYPVIVYEDATNDAIKVVRCDDAFCNSYTVNSIDSSGLLMELGADPALGIVPKVGLINNKPVVIYQHDPLTVIILAKCLDTTCSTVEDFSVVASDSYSVDSDLVIRDGKPIIAGHNFTDDSIDIIFCNDAYCEGDDENIVTVDSSDLDYPSDLELGSDGSVGMVYAKMNTDISRSELMYLKCSDTMCSEFNRNIVDELGSSLHDSLFALTLDSEDIPYIAYVDQSTDRLKYIKCSNTECSGVEHTPYVLGESGSVINNRPDLIIDSLGNPFISYYEEDGYDLSVIHCDNPDCSGDQNNIFTIDSSDDVGKYPSIVLNQYDIPLISYYDMTNRNLKFVAFNDISPAISSQISLGGRNDGDLDVLLQVGINYNDGLLTSSRTTNLDGSFSNFVIPVIPVGEHDIYLKPTYYLSEVQRGVDLYYYNNDIGTVEESFRWGDLNNDDKVNAIDFGHIVVNWGSGSTEIHDGDYNADGEINSLDYGGFVLNYNETGEYLGDLGMAWQW